METTTIIIILLIYAIIIGALIAYYYLTHLTQPEKKELSLGDKIKKDTEGTEDT
jgi:hypothetical protein